MSFLRFLTPGHPKSAPDGVDSYDGLFGEPAASTAAAPESTPEQGSFGAPEGVNAPSGAAPSGATSVPDSNPEGGGLTPAATGAPSDAPSPEANTETGEGATNSEQVEGQQAQGLDAGVAEEAAADGEVDAVSEPEGDAAQEDGQTPFLQAGDSVYHTIEEVERGVAAKDSYIKELRQQMEERDGNLGQIQQELEAAREKLTRYESSLPEEALEDLSLQDYMPEEFKGKAETDFETDHDRVAFKAARLDAAAKYRHARSIQKAERDAAERQRAEAHEAAKSFVTKTATPDFFGATNPEDSQRLKNLLDTTPEGGDFTQRQMAEFIGASFGQDAALNYLKGLKTALNGTTARSVGRHVTKTTVTPPKPTPPPPPRPSAPMSADEMLVFGFQTQNGKNPSARTR